MRISDWSSDVCSSDLRFDLPAQPVDVRLALRKHARPVHAWRRRVEQARSLAGALAAQLHDLLLDPRARVTAGLYRALLLQHHLPCRIGAVLTQAQQGVEGVAFHPRSEEHTSELKSLMRNSYAVFCS